MKLSKDNCDILQRPEALRQEGIRERIPITILNAIDFVHLLGERYLWVDSLCIVQDDDEDRKQGQLNSMAAIYANGSLNIVAADGSNAAYGLRGVRELSKPMERNIRQEFVEFGQNRSIVERIFPAKNGRRKGSPTKIYYQRAWTFQEYLLAKRRVIFERDSIFWECCSTT
jgi:hypothetical protein